MFEITGLIVSMDRGSPILLEATWQNSFRTCVETAIFWLLLIMLRIMRFAAAFLDFSVLSKA